MYIKLTNGAPTEYTIGQLRRDNPNVSFPKQIPTELLAEFDVYPAVVASIPDHNQRTQKLSEATTATQVEGVWTYTVTVSDKTAEEIQAYDDAEGKSVRSERDSLLAQTDFYALSDVTMSAEMATYRQALRDITDHANFPYLNDADWPTKP